LNVLHDFFDLPGKPTPIQIKMFHHHQRRYAERDLQPAGMGACSAEYYEHNDQLQGSKNIPLIPNT
jgi:hypothetical protein